MASFTKSRSTGGGEVVYLLYYLWQRCGRWYFYWEERMGSVAWWTSFNTWSLVYFVWVTLNSSLIRDNLLYFWYFSWTWLGVYMLWKLWFNQWSQHGGQPKVLHLLNQKYILIEFAVDWIGLTTPYLGGERFSMYLFGCISFSVIMNYYFTVRMLEATNRISHPCVQVFLAPREMCYKK